MLPLIRNDLSMPLIFLKFFRNVKLPVNLQPRVFVKWYHHVWNDDVRWKTEQPHLSATVQARHLSLFGHTV